VEWAGETIKPHEFGSRKDLALLCYLAAEGATQARQHLAALFWHDKTERQGLNNLNRVLSQLRKLLPGCLQCDQYYVWLEPEGEFWLDTAVFRQLETERTAESLATAVSLYHGEFMAGFMLDSGFEFESWLTIQREQWLQKTGTVLRQLIDYYTYYEDEQYEQGLGFATRLLEIQPWRESAHRQTMRILARSDRFSAALMQYEICKRVLAQELNVEPSRDTIELYERIKQARVTPKHNLPTTLTPLVGRKPEMTTLSRWLADGNCRLITITGLAGIGKTRVALATAQAKVGLFLHGVYFMSLTAVSHPNQLIYTLAETLEIPLPTHLSPLETVSHYLANKEILLILDNFDHLIDEASLRLLQTLLMASRHLKIIITSRQRLKLSGEHVLAVAGLEVADTAVQLFLQTAQNTQTDFAPTAADMEAIGTICKHLLGVPLAIELAATWIRTTSCRQIARAIEGDLLFLGKGSFSAENIQTAFDYSWNHLTAAEQAVFRKLAVFRGSFAREAAQSVTGASLPTLTSLVDKSLLHWNLQSRRYEIHALLRQYAAQKLAQNEAEQTAVEIRHGRYYADICQKASDLESIRQEIGNMQMGWAYGIAHKQLQDVTRSLHTALNLAYHTQTPSLMLAVLLGLVMLWDDEEARQTYPLQDFLLFIQHHAASNEETRHQAQKMLSQRGLNVAWGDNGRNLSQIMLDLLGGTTEPAITQNVVEICKALDLMAA
jgi:predicted ATPase/DNA-binding SARP family transcriptional activator